MCLPLPQATSFPVLLWLRGYSSSCGGRVRGHARRGRLRRGRHGDPPRRGRDGGHRWVRSAGFSSKSPTLYGAPILDELCIQLNSEMIYYQ